MENENCLETNFRGAKHKISMLNIMTSGSPAKKLKNLLSFWKSTDIVHEQPQVITKNSKAALIARANYGLVMEPDLNSDVEESFGYYTLFCFIQYN